MNTNSLLPINHLLPRARVQPPPNGWPATLDFTVRFADGRAGPPDEQMPLPKPDWIRVTDPIELTLPEVIQVFRDGSVQLKSMVLSEQEIDGILHRATAHFGPTAIARAGDLTVSPGWAGRSVAADIGEIRTLIAGVVKSDVVQGLLALRGRKTLLRLLLGVVPAHVAAELLPGTDTDNNVTLRKRIGAVSNKLNNRGGIVVVEQLRKLLATEPDDTSSSRPRSTGTTGRLKRSGAFD